MDEFPRIVAILLAIWGGYHLLVFLATWVQILRLALHPASIELDADEPLPPDAFTEDQHAWLSDLHGLGFGMARTGWMTQGPLRSRVAYLQHDRLPVLATVSFTPGVLTLYPVQFVSQDAQGRLLITQNRLGWLHTRHPHDHLVQNVCAASWQPHFDAHVQRLSNAVELDVAVTIERLRAAAQEHLKALQQHGDVVHEGQAWHFRPKPAAIMAARVWRQRKALGQSFDSPALQDDSGAAFLAHCQLLEEQLRESRPARHNLKALVLVLSMGLTLAFWGWAFDWRLALALVAVLLVHEGGHALAMRAFGWKDMSMFFVPFVGAMVTGRPAQVPAWKHAVVLLAGPVPGLLAGVAYLWWGHPTPDALIDWHHVAVIAVGVNLFNLLPLTPLDGGQLLDALVFSRWPRLRWAFWLCSGLVVAALALYLREPVFFALAVWMGLMLTSLWRLAQLKPLDAGKEDRFGQLRDLFRQAGDLFPKLSPLRLMATVKSLLARRMIAAPRWWESTFALVVLLAVWSGTAVGYALSTDTLTGRHDEARSPAQLQFDRAWYADDDDDSAGAALRRLKPLAPALAARDPRHVDLQVLQTRLQSPEGRRASVEHLLRAGQDGEFTTLKSLLSDELDAVWVQQQDRPPADRMAALQEGVAWAERVRPGDLQSTVALRLRIIQTTDEMGQTQRARADLADLRQRTDQDESCRCRLRDVIRAQAWFHLSHDEPSDALQVLESSRYIDSIRQQHDGLSMDYAWALLMNGRTHEGLAMMKAAAYSKPYEPSLAQRLRGAQSREPWLDSPLELAYALEKEGHPAKAREALADSQAWYECHKALHDVQSQRGEPWQATREKHLRDIARRICPADSDFPSSGPS